MATSQRNDNNQVSGRKATENLENDQNTGMQKGQQKDRPARQDASGNNQSATRRDLKTGKKKPATDSRQSCEDEKRKEQQEKRIDEEIDRDYFDPVR